VSGAGSSTRRIRVVIPVVTGGLRNVGEFVASASPGTEITATQIERGPASIESEFDDALAAPDTILEVVKAERDGADAVVIDCMDDPGLLAAREMVSVPVLGPCQTTMHLASLLGHRFSVITVMEGSVPGFENRAKVYGLADKLASVRWVDIPVLDLADNADRLLRDLIDESVRSVELDGAHAIVFGCTGMLGYADSVRRGLEERGLEGVPVIDPIPATIRLAEALVDLRLRHSKRTYPEPPRKRIVGYGFAERAEGGGT
jgi:allantoin racemase